MIKLLFLTIFLFAGTCPLKADQTIEDDQDFASDLDNVKNPFEDGYPKPVVVAPVVHHEAPKPVVIPKPKPVIVPVITLPDLHVQGVIVGGGMFQAIINDQVVPLGTFIQGARVISVSDQGVGLSFKGKKFFLKVD
jgi:hypothetical protein